MKQCVFCKIVKGEIPAKIEFEDEKILVIHDINPKAPLHLLIIPKKHIKDLTTDNEGYWNKIGEVIKMLLKVKELKGVRLVHNIGISAEVPHMHFHFLENVAATRGL